MKNFCMIVMVHGFLLVGSEKKISVTITPDKIRKDSMGVIPSYLQNRKRLSLSQEERLSDSRQAAAIADYIKSSEETECCVIL